MLKTIAEGQIWEAAMTATFYNLITCWSFSTGTDFRLWARSQRGMTRIPSLKNVKIAGSSAGLSDFGDGATHQSVEDIAVYACGIMVAKALEAAYVLEKEGISVRVVNVSTLKPVDEDEIKRFSVGMKGIITAEEHSLIGGLASVITYILRGTPIPVIPIANDDRFGQSPHGYDELLAEYGLTAENIIASVKKLVPR